MCVGVVIAFSGVRLLVGFSSSTGWLTNMWTTLIAPPGLSFCFCFILRKEQEVGGCVRGLRVMEEEN